VFVGNVVTLIPLILNAFPGTKYGIPFPVLARASFGIKVPCAVLLLLLLLLLLLCCCCAVAVLLLCCAVLCCAVLCCAVLRRLLCTE